ncbi:hypothetical protein Q3G72_019810 [Acer saccharum]|nr:hypothetical protein Q3G72_019810 [Acer saccharum]
MWPSLIEKAKQGGIDVIQTYVFWNLREPKQGQYDFSGRNDIIGFIKQIQSQGLYACIRIGPFIESEWTYGGLPFWLHDVPGIVFRSDNEPFKVEYRLSKNSKYDDDRMDNFSNSREAGPSSDKFFQGVLGQEEKLRGESPSVEKFRDVKAVLSGPPEFFQADRTEPISGSKVVLEKIFWDHHHNHQIEVIFDTTQQWNDIHRRYFGDRDVVKD